MPSILDLLRLHNVFGASQPIGNDLPSQGGITGNQPIPGNQQNDIQNIFNQTYTPSHEASDAYNESINQMPQRNKPGIMRKIGASVIGAGYGPEAAEQATYAPYYRELEDWKTKIGPQEKAMTGERLENTQERIAANEITGRATQQKTIEERERHNKETEDLNNKKVAIAGKRADAYIYDRMHPNLVKTALPGDTVKFYDPKTGDLVKDTGIDSGSLTDEDRLALQTKNRIEEINAQGGQTRKTENLRDIHAKENIDLRGDKQIEVNDKKPITPGAANKPLTPSAVKTDIVNKAQKLINEHPEWSKFIKIDGASVTIPQPVGGWLGNGLTPEIRKEIMASIYGSTGTTNTNTNTGQKMKVVDKVTGKVIGLVPIGDVDKVDKSKYSVQVP